ncbi:MAG: uridine kinase family protein [Anaerolineae bacterium]
MSAPALLNDPLAFSERLYSVMMDVNPGVADMELYEFRYALDNLYPEGGWASVTPEAMAAIEERVNSATFYESIQIKPRVDDRIVLDSRIVRLAQMLFVGLVTGEYPVSWVRTHFYFDIRGFYFLHRTTYFTERIVARLGGAPLRQFPQRQAAFERRQDVGYKEFREANAEVDAFFMDSVWRLIAAKGTPIVLAIAGPTAAGKTEIVARLRAFLEQRGRGTTSIEMDNFLTDREYREAKGIYTLGKQAIHLGLLQRALEDITRGKRIAIPRYDFVFATSSHDLDGNLKPGCVPLEIEPADIVFIEGNFPFLIEEVAHLIGIKVVYLTDDPIRLKRKWKRDIDYRKKYEPSYFRNRFFKEQFLMAEKCYRPQMELCDMVVDTTGAAVWATPEVAAILRGL